MKPDKKLAKKPKAWWSFLWNKYTIVAVIFAVWMYFFDRNSYFIHKELNHEIKVLSQEKQQFKEKLEKESLQLQQMKSDPEEIERIARERHFLKKENEDVFIIEQRKIKKKTEDATTNK